jgi:hypothetical protein
MEVLKLFNIYIHETFPTAKERYNELILTRLCFVLRDRCI